MPDYKLQKPATAGADWDNYAISVMTDMHNNPATTADSVSSRTGLNIQLVNRILGQIERAGALMRAVDTSGSEFLWCRSDFIESVVNNLTSARTWLQSNDGRDVTDMAIDLGLHEAIAISLATVLQSQGELHMSVV